MKRKTAKRKKTPPVLRSKIIHVRFPNSFEEAIKNDPATSKNFSAVARASLDSFLAAGTVPTPTRQLTRLLDDKVSDTLRHISVPKATARHYARMAKALKAKSVSALFINALGALYGLLPGTPASAALVARTGSVLRAAA